MGSGKSSDSVTIRDTTSTHEVISTVIFLIVTDSVLVPDMVQNFMILISLFQLVDSVLYLKYNFIICTLCEILIYISSKVTLFQLYFTCTDYK